MPAAKDLSSMTDAEFKVFENRLRRMAKRQGLRLEKTRRRDPRALDYGKYMLVNVETNAVVFGADSGRMDVTLDRIAAYLEGE